MQRVISINLNGNAYQVDETGFAALTAYLERASAQLAGNPDRAEILADLEQAIADKCRRTLGAHKTVVTHDEVRQILEEMGPVDGGTGEAGATATGAGGEAGTTATALPKRIYRISEGKVFSGVCQGLAAYFDVDVVFVRVFFVALNVLSGLGFLLYIVLTFALPRADTPEERAAAYGHRFNAQEVIDRAKRSYAALGSDRESRRQWRRQRREWKRQWRAARSGAPWAPPAGYAVPVVTGTTVMVTGVIGMVFAILHTIGAVVLVLAVVSLFTTGAIFGWPVPDNVPHWLAAVVLVVIYQGIAAPLLFLRHAPYFRNHWSYGGWIGTTSNGLLQLAVAAFVVWLAYHHVPEVRAFVDDIPRIWHHLAAQ
jgi:phage shock protein PspC (stress-responsive transcriptional regulator)